MILLSRKNSVDIEVLEDAVALFVRFDAYEAVCRYSKLNNSPTSLTDPSFLKPRPLEVDKSLKCLSNILIELIRMGAECSYYEELLRKTLFFLFDVFYTKEQVVNFFYPILNPGFKFKTFIYNNYLQVPTVKELIERSRLSRTAFYKNFKQEFGLSAKQWLVQKKTNLISDKFKNGTLTIKEIMFETGFDSHSQFTRFCKANLGDIPSNLIHKLRV